MTQRRWADFTFSSFVYHRRQFNKQDLLSTSHVITHNFDLCPKLEKKLLVGVTRLGIFAIYRSLGCNVRPKVSPVCTLPCLLRIDSPLRRSPQPSLLYRIETITDRLAASK